MGKIRPRVSGYNLYDSISAPYRRLLESLTATYAQPGFNKAANANGFELYTAERGAPKISAPSYASSIQSFVQARSQAGSLSSEWRIMLSASTG